MAAYTTIDDPSAYFKVHKYVGTGGSAFATTFSDTDTDMQPDLVWLKDRSGTGYHCLMDSARGATKNLYGNDSSVEDTDSFITSFNSDGFTVGAGNSDSNHTAGDHNYISWNWKESATSGFDIVEYTGTGSAHTESHSLSAVPKFWLIKNLTDSEHWAVYHGTRGATHNSYLNLTQAEATSSVYWNNTEPTSSVFTVGTENFMNENTKEFIAYIWAEKQGFSKFGQYIGNGNADGTFVYTGFSVGWLMLKRTDDAGSWWMFDTKRSPHNSTNERLIAEDSAAEAASGYEMDLLSNGFKLRNTGGERNGSGATIMYAAFAEAPLVNSNGVPCNAR